MRSIFQFPKSRVPEGIPNKNITADIAAVTSNRYINPKIGYTYKQGILSLEIKTDKEIRAIMTEIRFIPSEKKKYHNAKTKSTF